jgi:predicted GNAT superfamily acetyltransferase
MKQVPFKIENVTVNVEEYESYVYLCLIVVDELYRNRGLGTSVLIEIISYAECVKKPLLVYASNDFGGDL